MQVAAGSIDRDAGSRGDSQEVTALKFKAVESQASFLKRWTSQQECIYASHSNMRHFVVPFGVDRDVESPSCCTCDSRSRTRTCTSFT